ncbi:O-antigen ligase family protein [Herminiimonas aquatilis]|uniref:O-antigen ligase family protein n=1 Tax=Herminiimonas aquatilis TaxID=345342 RepID=A0ABW2J6V7_9BURK
MRSWLQKRLSEHMLNPTTIRQFDGKVHARWVPAASDAYAVLAVVVLALVMGIIVPFYTDVMDYKLARLLALPAILVFGFLLIFNRLLLLTLIILFRSTGDVILESTRFSLGSYETGVGGLINLCVIMLACMLVFEKPSRLPKKMTLSWVPFLLVALFGVVISPEKGDAIRTYLTLLSYFAMFVIAFYFVHSGKDFRHCIKLVLWSSVLPALYALVDVAMNGGAGGAEGFRLQSTFTHPNIFAFYLTLMIPLTLYVLKDKVAPLKSGSRVALTLYMFYMLALLVLTQTRSAWLALMIVFVAYALLFERRYLLYLMLLPVAALLIPEIRDRLMDLGSGTAAVGYAKLNSFAWRLSIWESGLQWMRPSQYVFGYGLEAFRHYSQTFFPAANHMNWGAHNVYVQWFFDVGLLGLSAYLFLYARVAMMLKSLIKVDKLAAFVSLSLVFIYLVVSSSDNIFGYLVFNWYFWFTVGIGCALATSVIPQINRPSPTRAEPHARAVQP